MNGGIKIIMNELLFMEMSNSGYARIYIKYYTSEKKTYTERYTVLYSKEVQ